jgi:hypothetical protein
MYGFLWKVQEPDTAAVSNPAPSANVTEAVPSISPQKETEQPEPVAEVPSITPQKETEQPKPVAKQPLSPYTA